MSPVSALLGGGSTENGKADSLLLNKLKGLNQMNMSGQTLATN